MKRMMNKANAMLWDEHAGVKRLFSLFTISGVSDALAGKKVRHGNGGDGQRTVPTFTVVQKIGLLLGPLLFMLIILFLRPEGLTDDGRAILAATAWMAVWWMTEALPIPVTALLPIILFPLFGGLSLDATTSAYGSDVIFLFLGGFVIAVGMEKWNLHKRIALSIISVVGAGTERLVLGFMTATAFISMWISSTASTMLMVPIAMAILSKVKELLEQVDAEDARDTEQKFGMVLLLSVSYSALTGGLATLIGTPPNAIFAGFVKESYGIEISFAGWMLFGVPIAVAFTGITYLLLVKVLYPFKIKELPGGEELIREQRDELGPMSREEKMVGILFALTAFAWISRTFLLQPYLSPNISDAMIAMVAALLLFLLPSKQNEGETLLTWDIAGKLPWGILILFGGGLAIAAGFSQTGLTEWIGRQLAALEGMPIFVIILAVVLLVIFLTEITSNTATATMLIPIMGALAMAVGVHPFGVLVGTTVAASCAFMFPIATPPNAIVFATGTIKISEMAKAGFWLNIVLGLLLAAAIYWYLPIVWDFNISELP